MNKEYEVKTDCFAYKEPANPKIKFGTCDALTDLFCKQEECRFYKLKGTEKQWK